MKLSSQSLHLTVTSLNPSAALTAPDSEEISCYHLCNSTFTSKNLDSNFDILEQAVLFIPGLSRMFECKISSKSEQWNERTRCKVGLSKAGEMCVDNLDVVKIILTDCECSQMSAFLSDFSAVCPADTKLILKLTLRPLQREPKHLCLQGDQRERG